MKCAVIIALKDIFYLDEGREQFGLISVCSVSSFMILQEHALPSPSQYEHQNMNLLN